MTIASFAIATIGSVKLRIAARDITGLALRQGFTQAFNLSEREHMRPFYRIASVVGVERRRRTRKDVGLPPPVHAPWCAHLYTPVSRYATTAIAGGWRKLVCSGDLANAK